MNATNTVADPEGKNYVLEGIQSFIDHPPGTDYQRGFLATMLIVATEALLIPKQNSVISRGEALLKWSQR
jgi:hypothetical protein